LAATDDLVTPETRVTFLTARKGEYKAQATLLRDIVGNPFRVLPALERTWLLWNDRTVPKLAQAAYKERGMPSGNLDSSRLAVMADALEDAGCHEEELLHHCCQEGVHVRGCWVIDLLLGKE
jgi:hypothetical protein